MIETVTDPFYLLSFWPKSELINCPMEKRTKQFVEVSLHNLLNRPYDPSCPSVGRMVGGVGHNFRKGWEVTLPCIKSSTYLECIKKDTRALQLILNLLRMALEHFNFFLVY